MAPILVADDSAVVRHAIEQRLRARGLPVLACASVAEARALVGTTLRAALLDFDLGDGHGTEIAPLLDAPVAFFTSEDDPTAFAAARRYGPVFRKPAEIDLAVEWLSAR